MRPLLGEIEKDIQEWIHQDKPISPETKRPIQLDGKSYAYAEYFKQKKIDPKFDTRYTKYYRNQRHTLAGSYVWADSPLSEFADELEKPAHDGKLCWIDVLINCQFDINHSGEVVGLTGEIYYNCEVLILLTDGIFKRAWCLLEAANYTRNGCKICVVGQCSFLQGEDYFAAMQAGVPSDVDLIKEEIARMFGANYHAKFNRAIDDAVVHVYGESLLYNGRFQEAVPVFEKELEVKKRRGDADNSVADTYLQLGRASDALGKYADSLRYYDEALQRYVRCFGTGHVSVAQTYNNMWLVFKELGDYEKALYHYQIALDIKIKSLGGAHASVAATESNIGNVYSSLGDYENALLHLQKALEIDLKTVGPSHVSVAATYKNMGVVQKELGNLQKALDLYQKALDIEIKSLGGAHVNVAATYGNIGNVLESQGKFDEALKMHQKCLEIQERTLGPSHVDVAKTYNNIAIVLERQGKYQDALETYQKLLDIKIKSLGLEHVSVADTKYNIALVYKRQGAIAQARRLFGEAGSIYSNVYGAAHSKTLEAFGQAQAAPVCCSCIVA